MASTIKLKNGSGAPTAGDLVQGEPALDLTNKRLYTEDAGGTVVEVGTNPTALTIGGTALTATATELNVLDGITATTAELNILDGVTATTAELNYTDGVTSNIQTQLNTKSPIDDATFTGTTTIPTADINGGTIDGTVIGGTTAAAGTFTTGQFDTSINVTGTVTADGLTVDAGGTTAILIQNANPGIVFDDTSAVGAGSDKFIIKSVAAQSLGDYEFVMNNDQTSSADVTVAKFSGNGDISFYEDTGTTAKLFWDASAEKLSVGGSTIAGTLNLPSTGTITWDSTSCAIEGNASGADYIKFTTNTFEGMRLDSSGNLLVGKTTADNATTGITFFPAGVGSFVADGSRSATFVRKSSDGSVVEFRRDTSTVGSISVTASTTAYNTSSDERLKENITDAPAGNVDDIKVRSFDWKVDGSHQYYGMVAQELEAVAPYAVTKGETEDDMWSVDYSKLVPMLIKEIQDLKAEVAALKGAN